jgi:hypothetical protein
MMKLQILLVTGMLCLGTICAAQNTFPGNGNVGIGTSTPVGSLDIFTAENTTTVPLISLRSNFHVAGNYGMIRFGDYTQTVQYQKGAIIYESVSGAARGKFHIAMENTDGPGSVTLADARLTVQSDGNVGIGVTNPSEKLSVNGKIRAKEVKVEATGWPDYVFATDYRPLTPDELERYISVNKHLPGLPSAKEAEENGVELGKMNKKLLEKIEELTLYMISQQKEIKALKEQINKK